MSNDEARELRKQIGSAISDPGATQGYKGDRGLAEWQLDAVMPIILEALRGASGGGAGEVRTWRHVKRGSTYREIGRAKLQAATIQPREGNTLVVYHGDDGQLWARLSSEFEDGRFEEIQPTPAAATVGAVEPTEAMIDAGVAFALQVSLGGEYR